MSLLDVARHAPSTFNTQPWRVHILVGDAKRELSAALTKAHEAATSSAQPAIPHSAPPEVRARQRDFFARYYKTIGIDPDDAAARINRPPVTTCSSMHPLALSSPSTHH